MIKTHTILNSGQINEANIKIMWCRSQTKQEDEREMRKRNDPEERKNVGKKKEGQGNTNTT